MSRGPGRRAASAYEIVGASPKAAYIGPANPDRGVWLHHFLEDAMRRCFTPLLAVLALAACDTPDPSTPEMLAPDAGTASLVDGAPNVLDVMNVKLAEDGAAVRVAIAELLLHAEHVGSEPMAQTIYAKDVGNGQLGHHFVSGDPGRGGRINITYAIDGTEAATASGLTAAATTAAIHRAMDTWNAETCSDPDLTNLGVAPFDLGFVQFILGMGGVPGWVADLTHAGWLPPTFFDALAEDGGVSILGVTFTFTWVGNIDQDGDGKIDVAFREIYYNDRFFWGVDVDRPFADVETIVLHEAGHGLSQAHFGTVAVHHRLGVKIQPEAVMNAIYFGQKQQLLGTDRSGHCGIWEDWS